MYLSVSTYQFTYTINLQLLGKNQKHYHAKCMHLAKMQLVLDHYTVVLYHAIAKLYKHITKTCLYDFDPLKPHFYVVKLGFTGVYTIFLISAQNIDCEYLLEPPRRGGSNEYPQSMF